MMTFMTTLRFVPVLFLSLCMGLFADESLAASSVTEVGQNSSSKGSSVGADSSPAPRRLTVSQAVDIALRKNPDILSYKASWKSTKKLEVTALAPADPQIQYLFGAGEQGNGPNGQGLPYQSGNNWAITQSVLFPGKSELGYRINKDNTRTAYLAYRAQRVSLRNQTEMACYQLLLAQKSISLNLEMQNWLARVLDITRTKLSVGSAQILDVVNAKVQLSQAKLDQLTAEMSEMIARRQLNALLAYSPDTPIEIDSPEAPVAFSRPLPGLEAQALKNRPDLLSSETNLELNRHQLTLTKMGYLPDFQFEGSMGGESCYGFAGLNCYYAGLQVNVPIFAMMKQKPQVDSAENQVRSASFQYQWQAMQVRLNVDNSYSQVVLGYRQYGISDREIIPQTRLAFDLALTGYENQKNDFLYLISAIQAYKQARYVGYQNLIGYYQALSNLEAAVGESLPELNGDNERAKAQDEVK
jgi:outer membrane protein TolC